MLLKRYFFYIFLLFSWGNVAQTQDSLLLNLQEQIKELKKLRVKDSLKIDILSTELQTIIIEGQKVEDKKEDSTLIKKRITEIQRLKSQTEGAPIIIENDTLYKIFATVGGYTPLERARLTSSKIKKVAEDVIYYSDSLIVRKQEDIQFICYRGEILQVVTPTDALWFGISDDELSHIFLDKINKNIKKYRVEHSFKTKLWRIGELALMIFAIAAFFFGLRFLFRKLQVSFFKMKFYDKGIRIKNYNLLNRNQIHNIVSKILMLIHLVLFFVVLFSTIPFALKLFPSTKIWAEKLQKLILEPFITIWNAIIDYLPNLVIICIILFITKLIMNLLRYFLYEIERGALKIKDFYREWAKPTYNIIRGLLICFVLIIIFPYLPGAGSFAFQGVSVFLGLLISLGSSSTISNAIAGILITYMRPFKENDWIKTGNITGLVVRRNSLVTRLKTINNEEVTVPNSAILTGSTINYSSIGKMQGLVITAQVSVSYDVDYEKVTDLLIEAAVSTKGICNKVKPYVFQISLNEINATYEINAVTDDPQNMYYIKSDLIKNIQHTFRQRNVRLSSIKYIEIRK
ncbi:MAG: mechanosensitive ion channel [Capnocytophaga sp.]|nr:mechanosensitive ion channel [Capnocytophaga sp.]